MLMKDNMKLETTFNIIPSKDYVILEAYNNICKIRVAEKNNKVIYRLIKTSIKLYLKTLKYFLLPLLGKSQIPISEERAEVR
jgi:hypothetical protein